MLADIKKSTIATLTGFQGNFPATYINRFDTAFAEINY